MKRVPAIRERLFAVLATALTMRTAFIYLLCAIAAIAQTPAWVAQSNRNAQLLIDLNAKYSPEAASSRGVQGLDDQISVLSADRPARIRADLRKIRAEFEKRFIAENNPYVRQDIRILVEAIDKDIRSSEANEETFLPYRDVAGFVFFGVKSLLDDQVQPSRRPAAAVRLRKYAGISPGYAPITETAEKLFLEKRAANPALLYPSKIQLEKDLANTDTYVTGIGLLLEKYKVAGYEDAYARLKQQLASYGDFVRREILPHARTDFRLPPRIYSIALDDYGVDYTPAELERLAHRSFTEIQRQMSEIAAHLAKDRNLPSPDYRSVIRELKKEQLSGDQILPHYRRRLAEIEEIIRENHLVSLPERPAIIRLASAAETAQQPAPHMQIPPLINNHGQRGQFVLPLGTKGEGGAALKYDDFTFAAASWTLTAHEARPGHELQFDSMIERGVSLARAMFAFNSVNAEGWGLYSEWFMLPYMPDDGKLISLQLRLLRAARAFLDPELQEGNITPQQAMDVLQNDVVCSKAFATEEVDRFTFRSPGQAVSYFDGYTRLLEIRNAAEQALGPKFAQQRFHDFILSQGLLPPELLRNAVMEEFVVAEKAAARGSKGSE